MDSKPVRHTAAFEEMIVKAERDDGHQSWRVPQMTPHLPPSSHGRRKRDFDCLSDDEDSRQSKKLSVRADLQETDESSDSEYESERHPDFSHANAAPRSGGDLAGNLQRYMELVTQMARIQELQRGIAPSMMPWPMIIPAMPRMYQVPGMFSPYVMYPNAMQVPNLPWAQEVPRRPIVSPPRDRLTSPAAKVRKCDTTERRTIAPVRESESNGLPLDMSIRKNKIHEKEHMAQKDVRDTKTGRNLHHENDRCMKTIMTPVANASRVTSLPLNRKADPSYELRDLPPLRPRDESTSPEVPVQRNYECAQCKMRTRSHHGLKRHLLSHGDCLPAKPAVCAKCRQQFLNVFDLYFHVLSHEQGDNNNNHNSDNEADTQELPSQAETSEEPLGKYASKKLHPRYYECGECGLTVRSYYGLSRHFNKHDLLGPLPAICTICRVAFPDAVKLQAHIMTHPKAAADIFHRKSVHQV